jgi:hypothetical protein
MADRDGDTAFWSKVQKEDLPHCGLCDPVSRHIELDDGRIARCPRCHPLQTELLPQTWRCPVCHALIYRDQRGLPCSVHRTVTGWQRAYDAAQVTLPLVNPVTEAGAKIAREALASRPRPEPRPSAEGAGLTGEALARAQLAELRAARESSPLADETSPPEQPPDDDEYPF